MNILVTGAAGFIGSNLVHYLLKEASGELGLPINKVINLDALTYAGNPGNLAGLESDERHLLVKGDICDESLVRDLLATHEIDAVMHLAAESHVDRYIESPEQFIQTNVVGTFRPLPAFLDHCAATGECIWPQPNGSTCDRNAACSSGICTGGICQKLPSACVAP